MLAAYGVEGPIGWFEADLGVLLAAARHPRTYRPVSRFPSADVDLAFVVGESVSAGEVRRTLLEAGGERLESVELFDVFRGPQLGDGRRSLALRLRFSALDHTLTEEELSALRSQCVAAVVSAHGADLRS